MDNSYLEHICLIYKEKFPTCLHLGIQIILISEYVPLNKIKLSHISKDKHYSVIKVSANKNTSFPQWTWEQQLRLNTLKYFWVSLVLDTGKHSFWKPVRDLAFILTSNYFYCKLIAHDIHLGVSFKSLSVDDRLYQTPPNMVQRVI